MAIRIAQPSFDRLSAEALAAWKEIPTAVISDELNRTGTMAAAIGPLGPGMGFAAQALTVQAMVGDNAVLHHALLSAWPGCVLVVDGRGHEDTAIWGGILTAAAQARGVAALVVDGAVRDAAELRASGLSVYTRAVVPNGPHKGFGGGINVTIQCAGTTVRPGDLVVGDDDGIVVVPLDHPDGLEAIIGRARARIAKEEGILKKIADGVSTVELLGIPPADQVG